MSKDTYLDFNHIKESHSAVHKRLLNWGEWFRDREPNSISPMFREYRSNWRQWHEPEMRNVVDGIDAQRVQKLMVRLPIEHRRCLAWCYTSNKPVGLARREMAQTKQGLYQLLTDARQMIVNLG